MAIQEDGKGTLRWWCIDKDTDRLIARGWGPAPRCQEERYEVIQTRDVEPVKSIG